MSPAITTPANEERHGELEFRWGHGRARGPTSATQVLCPVRTEKALVSVKLCSCCHEFSEKTLRTWKCRAPRPTVQAQSMRSDTHAPCVVSQRCPHWRVRRSWRGANPEAASASTQAPPLGHDSSPARGERNGSGDTAGGQDRCPCRERSPLREWVPRADPSATLLTLLTHRKGRHGPSEKS